MRCKFFAQDGCGLYRGKQERLSFGESRETDVKVIKTYYGPGYSLQAKARCI